MENNPVSFLQEYFIKKKIMPGYTVIESRNGTHQNWFRIRVECGQESADGEGTSKKEAKLNAAKGMMQLLGLVSTDRFTSTNTVDTSNVSTVQGNPPTSTLNYISSLQEIAQKKGSPLPVYMDKVSVGPSHAPTFTTVCQYDGFQEEASATTKKESKVLAAKKVFERVSLADSLNDDVKECNSHKEPNNNSINTLSTTNISTVERNPATSGFNCISALQEIAQQSGSVIPTYIDKGKTGQQHAPIFTVICKFKEFEEEASATTKKEAKSLAARKVFIRINPTHSLNSDTKVCHSQGELDIFLETVDKGVKELQIYGEDLNALAQSAEKALKRFLPLSKTSAATRVNSTEKLSYNDYHKFLKDAFSDTVRERVIDKLQDLIRACQTYKNNNDYRKPMKFLQQALEELNIKVKEVDYGLRNKDSVFGLQLDTDPVVSEIGHGDSKLSAVIQTVMQMAITVCILIA